MLTTGGVIPSQRITPPPPLSAVFPVKELARSSTCEALMCRAAPPSPDALFRSNRDPWIVADAFDVTAIAPPELAAVLLIKVES
jgi:hypothetical protein